MITNLFDGELVIDKPWRKDNSSPIFLIFDALIVNTVNVVSSPFHKRLVDANAYVLKRFLPVRGTVIKPGKLPAIDIYLKEMFHIWDAHELFGALIESDKLEHENDGLIFTVDQCPYYPGTCEQILKWKPIELNSIDFILKASPVDGVFELHTADNQFFSHAVFD